MLKNETFVTFSVVSHGQMNMIRDLINDLNSVKNIKFELLITLNIIEDFSDFPKTDFPIKIIKNLYQKGFGSNHNYAFKFSSGNFFLIINPDIRFNNFSLDELLNAFDDDLVGAVAPLILTPTGFVDDSARRFPSIFNLILRTIFGIRSIDYPTDCGPVVIDWAGGMFLLFRKDIFTLLNGFDDKNFYMYFEDVDICRRLKMAGYKLMLIPHVNVIHYAQRASRKNIKYLIWHFKSALIYFYNTRF